MPKIRPLKIIFGTVAGGVIVGAVTVAAVNVANAHLYENSPTPLEFAARYDITYSDKTTAYLRQFDDVRVIAATPDSLAKICKINFFNCDKGSLDNLGSFAYTPTWQEKIWGLRPTIFLRPYDPNLINTTLKFVSGKTSTVMTADHSRMMFDLTILHETGHLATYRRAGPKNYYAMTVREKELDADVTSLPYMQIEYGSAGPDFVGHLRALTQSEFTHDNLPKLKNLNPKASQKEADTFKLHSDLSWTHYMAAIETCTKVDPRNGKMTSQVFDQFYACVQAEQRKSPAPAKDHVASLLADRKKSYVQAYNYFFGPPAAP